MAELKYKYKDLFRGGKLVRKFLYKEFEDLQNQINQISGGTPQDVEIPSPVTVKTDVELTAQALGSNFGAANKFDGVGVVKNQSGTYIVVSDGTAFKYISLDDLS